MDGFFTCFILSISFVPVIVFNTTDSATAPVSAEWPMKNIQKDEKGYYIEAGYFPQRLIEYNGTGDITNQGNVQIDTGLYTKHPDNSNSEPLSWEKNSNYAILNYTLL